MSVLSPIYLGNKQEAIDELITQCTQGSTIISFLYFANCMKARLLEKQEEQWQRDYKESLMQSDFLFADGIALQLFYRFSSLGRIEKITPHNLNGTDLIPEFLDQFIAHATNEKKNIHWAMHTLYDPRIGKSKEQVTAAVQAFEERFGVTMNYVQQNLYAERLEKPFDCNAYSQSLKDGSYSYNIVLLFTGTPAQEIWSLHNAAFIRKENIIVVNAGGLIDYIAGFEKRAPKRVVRARVLETPWRILQHPKKNFHKFASMFGIVRYWRGLLLK